MNQIPFNNSEFQDTWLKHFRNSENPTEFTTFGAIKFYKKSSGVYVNIGKNITNGNYYSINANAQDFKGNMFMIYDVPSYFKVAPPENSKLKLFKINQYKGFATELQDYASFDDFFTAQFKSGSRYKYRRNVKRLEACFDIDYKIYNGHISEEEYEHICKFLKKNLSRRFGFLGLDNNIVSKWTYYHDLMFKLINSGEGVLTAIYDAGKPIGISFGFLSEKTMFFAITSFDIDYMKYNLGHTTIMKLMQWCFDNGYEVYDFSKGQYEYKDRWTNLTYNYECHILYDSTSIIARARALYYTNYFKLKQFLRDRNINRLYTQLKHKLKGNDSISIAKFSIEKLEALPETISEKNSIDIKEDAFVDVRYHVYQFLYNNPEKAKDLKVFQAANKNIYYVLGAKHTLRLEAQADA